MKRCILAFIAAFVFMIGFEFVWHEMLMKPAYMETASLWRQEPQFPLLMLGQAIIAFFFVGIYCRGFSANGVAGGVRLGVMLGLLCAGGDLIRFAVQPLTTKILCMSVVGGVIELAIVGAIVGAIYRPSADATA